MPKQIKIYSETSKNHFFSKGNGESVMRLSVLFAFTLTQTFRISFVLWLKIVDILCNVCNMNSLFIKKIYDVVKKLTIQKIATTRDTFLPKKLYLCNKVTFVFQISLTFL